MYTHVYIAKARKSYGFLLAITSPKSALGLMQLHSRRTQESLALQIRKSRSFLGKVQRKGSDDFVTENKQTNRKEKTGKSSKGLKKNDGFSTQEHYVGFHGSSPRYL